MIDSQRVSWTAFAILAMFLEQSLKLIQLCSRHSQTWVKFVNEEAMEGIKRRCLFLHLALPGQARSSENSTFPEVGCIGKHAPLRQILRSMGGVFFKSFRLEAVYWQSSGNWFQRPRRQFPKYGAAWTWTGHHLGPVEDPHVSSQNYPMLSQLSQKCIFSANPGKTKVLLLTDVSSFYYRSIVCLGTWLAVITSIIQQTALSHVHNLWISKYSQTNKWFQLIQDIH